MSKLELLAPAGDLEKLKIAYLYGADACYIGGKKFSLRARASNFTNEDILEGVNFAHNLNKKLYVTMNIVPHDEDFDGLVEYLKYLESIHVDGIIVSSMYIASVAKEYAPKLERHLSTQASVSNHNAIKYYESKGFSRVVLARECSLDEIKSITRNVKAEVEVFIHGGMCISYSGRCMLSNYMTNRDANRGGCAHSCRWNYELYKNGLKINKDFFNMGSKDLNAIKFIFDLIDANVTSLKIEGRMKSLFYIACIVRTYRMIIDDYYKYNGNIKKLDIKFYEKELLKAENRVTSVGFFNGPVTKREQIYNMRTEIPTKDFLGVVLDYNKDDKIITIEQRNYFKLNDKVEFFGPNLKNSRCKIIGMYNENNEEMSVARHPLEIIKLKLDKDIIVSKFDMMRK